MASRVAAFLRGVGLAAVVLFLQGAVHADGDPLFIEVNIAVDTDQPFPAGGKGDRALENGWEVVDECRLDQRRGANAVARVD
jgi:hypothetical protein